MKKNIRKWNPYLTSYLTLAMLCCVVLSVLFLWINLENTKRSELKHMEEKLQLIAEDLETQFEAFQKINLLISIDSLYQPFYFTRNKYFELKLLNGLTQYQSYSPLITEYFLYYQGFEYIFHSSECTIALKTWLSGREDSRRQELFRLLTHPGQSAFFYSPEELLVLLPLSAVSRNDKTGAVLCIVIDHDRLSNRIQTVSGGLDGSLAVYADGQLIYSGRETFLNNDRHVISYEDSSGIFSLRYLPAHPGYSGYSLLPLQLLLVTAVVILVLFIASLFAYHSYKPLLLLAEKYRGTVPVLPAEARFDNKLEEINFMMEAVLKNNITANTRLEQYQGLLRDQILLLLLNGRYTFNIQPYLPQVGLLFPGPFFFAAGLFFCGREEPPGEIYLQLKQFLEDLSEPEEEKYIYAVVTAEQKSLSVLCSISDHYQKEEISEDIQDFLESISAPSPQNWVLGCGNAYGSLSNLSASYLEALDSPKNAAVLSAPEKACPSPEGTHCFLYSKSDIEPVCSALSAGNEEAALKAFDSYFSAIESDAPSLLMQQYLFSHFLTEMTRLSRECRIELSRQSVSLILAARDCPHFSTAARTLIHEFCGKILEQKNRLAKDQSFQIFQYVNKHFTEYELSIESIAESQNTSTAFVRSAILEHTGRKYKDYLIYLRIEYAKKLLAKEGLSVAQTCQRVGYSNISYFIKAFKAQTGVTPASYKRAQTP